MRPGTRVGGIEALVLSPTPLTVSQRGQIALTDGNVVFADLAALVRDGIRSSLRALRSLRPARIVLTGSEWELFVFQDLLALLALCVPTGSRQVLYPDQPPRRLRLPAPVLVARMALSTVRALFSVCANARDTLVMRSSSPELSGGSLNRCLYVRPTLMFGPPVGGSVGHVAGVVNALRRRGQELQIAAMFDQPLVGREVGQILIPPAFRAAYPNDLNRHRYFRIFLREALQLARRYAPDYLYVRYSLSDMTGAVLRRTLRKPLVLEYNGSEVWAQTHWGRRLVFQEVSRRMEVANLLSADLVVVVSEELRKEVLQAGVSAEKVLFYPNCVDPELFDPALFGGDSRQETRRSLGIPLDADLFTFVGTFGQWHGTDVLATAIRTMLDTRRSWLQDRRMHFLFVGDGPLAPKVRAILGPEAKGPFVTLAGYRPQAETARVLAASDVLLSPHVPNPDGTPFFGSPTKLFEYMAMARPIVASDLDQIGQVLRGWSPGSPTTGGVAAAILVRPGDAASLEEGIRLAAGMAPEQRQQLGAAAREYVLRAFTWDKNVDAVLGALQSVLNRNVPSTIGRDGAGVRA